MTDRIDSERLEQAVGWRVRLAESPELYAEELSSWLAQDPRNREAWRSAQASWDFLGPAPADKSSSGRLLDRLTRGTKDHMHAVPRHFGRRF